jgi:predicted aldo/keto reductase-like oxidoreductase
MPLNVMDAHFRSFGKEVVPVLVKKQMGVLGLKPMGGGNILKANVVTPLECLQYALSLPASVVITGVDSMEILDQAFQTAKTYSSLSKAEIPRDYSKN